MQKNYNSSSGPDSASASTSESGTGNSGSATGSTSLLHFDFSQRLCLYANNREKIEKIRTNNGEN